MSCDYSLEVETDLPVKAFADAVVNFLPLPVLGIEPLKSGYFRISLADTSIEVYPQEPLDVPDIFRTYGFKPQVGMLISVDEDVPALDLDAVMALSAKLQNCIGRDAVLLFNFETPVVLFKDGNVILNENWRSWDLSCLPTELRHRNPQVRPLGIKGT
jgi:hypothetical protein